MRVCCMPLCQLTDDSTVNPNLSFFKPPQSNLFMRKKWYDYFHIHGVENLKNKQLFICEKHFLPSDISRNRHRNKLKWNALPIDPQMQRNQQQQHYQIPQQQQQRIKMVRKLRF